VPGSPPLAHISQRHSVASCPDLGRRGSSFTSAVRRRPVRPPPHVVRLVLPCLLAGAESQANGRRVKGRRSRSHSDAIDAPEAAGASRAIDTACCLIHDLPLATLNAKDFADCAEHDGLRLTGTEAR
jgi:hypothetical protein